MSDFVVVGRIGRPHGVRGEVTVEPRTDEPARRFAVGNRLGLMSGSGTLTVAAMREYQGRVVLHFEELSDRNAAEAMRGEELTCVIDPQETPDDPEEFYDHQLLGLRVRTPDGAEVGQVRRIQHGAAQDLLVIETPQGEVLFPFVTALVPEVDVAAGHLVIEDRPGLLGEADPC